MADPHHYSSCNEKDVFWGRTTNSAKKTGNLEASSLRLITILYFVICVEEPAEKPASLNFFAPPFSRC